MVAITGASGLIGEHVAREASARGHTVRPLGRGSTPPFNLNDGRPRLTSALVGADALIHCAYAYLRVSAQEAEVNVEGTRRLLDAATLADVPRILITSSMSAAPEVPSTYGAAKRSIESIAAERGAMVVRPGLVWDDAGDRGLVAGMRAAVRRLPIIPVPRVEVANQVLVHARDLAAVILRAVEDTIPADRPLPIAHPEALRLEEIARRIARRDGRRVRIIRLPSAVAIAGLRLAEFSRVPLPFRADNILGVIHAPTPTVGGGAPLGVPLRPFAG